MSILDFLMHRYTLDSRKVMALSNEELIDLFVDFLTTPTITNTLPDELCNLIESFIKYEMLTRMKKNK